MKVVFLEDLPGKAEVGEIKEVANGFARNYLIPRKIAVLATPEQVKRVDALRRVASQRRDKTEEEMQTLVERLKKTTLVIKAKAGSGERLYGSVTSAVIARELSKLLDHQIDKRGVALDEPIRRLGRYEVSIKLSQDIALSVTTVIEPEEKVKAKGKAAAEVAAKPKVRRVRKKAEPSPPDTESVEEAKETESELKKAEVTATETAAKAPAKKRRKKMVIATEKQETAAQTKRKRVKKRTSDTEDSATSAAPRAQAPVEEAPQALEDAPADKEPSPGGEKQKELDEGTEGEKEAQG